MRYLTENGREVLGWRVVDGEPVLVVVAIGFVIVAQPSEDFEVFRARMLRFASRLAAMRYPVLHLTLSPARGAAQAALGRVRVRDAGSLMGARGQKGKGAKGSNGGRGAWGQRDMGYGVRMGIQGQVR
jgi:hypothetical protein